MRLLAVVLLLAQEGLPAVPPPMAADEEPSAAACTFAAVLRGAACLYEAASGPAEARDNSRAAPEAGQRACAVGARRAEGLRKDCGKAVAGASLSPGGALPSRPAAG